MSKADKIRELARNREKAAWPNYTQIDDYHDGKHSCDYVSPYSKSAHNFDAELFLMLQDWTSEKNLLQPEKPDQIRLGHTPTSPTNKNLKRLLHEVYGLKLEDTFATNLFPFIKSGGKSSKIPRQDLERAAKEYGIPQVEIIAPKVVICFGFVTYKAIQVAIGITKSKSMKEAMESPFEHNGVTFYCQAHPGGLGLANRGGFAMVQKDWEKMLKKTGSLKGLIQAN